MCSSWSSTSRAVANRLPLHLARKIEDAHASLTQLWSTVNGCPRSSSSSSCQRMSSCRLIVGVATHANVESRAAYQSDRWIWSLFTVPSAPPPRMPWPRSGHELDRPMEPDGISKQASRQVRCSRRPRRRGSSAVYPVITLFRTESRGMHGGVPFHRRPS